MIEIKTKGMHCKSCEILVKESLEEEMALNVNADYKTGIVKFTNLELKKAIKIIKEEGYEVI